MPTTLTPKKIQKHFNMFFGEVNSFIGNVYKKLLRSPGFPRSLKNGNRRSKKNRHTKSS